MSHMLQHSVANEPVFPIPPVSQSPTIRTSLPKSASRCVRVASPDTRLTYAPGIKVWPKPDTQIAPHISGRRGRLARSQPWQDHEACLGARGTKSYSVPLGHGMSYRCEGCLVPTGTKSHIIPLGCSICYHWQRLCLNFELVILLGTCEAGSDRTPMRNTHTGFRILFGKDSEYSKEGHGP